MDKNELKERTKRFALRVMRLADALPKSTSGGVIGKQLLRAGTAVGANYRAVCRAQSRADVMAKLGLVIEDADASAFWLELVMDGELLARHLVEPLHGEAEELTAIFIASLDTARKNHREARS